MEGEFFTANENEASSFVSFLLASRIINTRKVNFVCLLSTRSPRNEAIVSIVGKGNVILFDDNTRCTRLESKCSPSPRCIRNKSGRIKIQALFLDSYMADQTVSRYE